MALTRRRMVTIGRFALISGLTFTVFGAAAGLAWGCVPQPRLVTVQPRASGPAGTEVTVAALGFDPGRAEVRWNAADGELLASAEGPDFSVPVTIPQAQNGVYHVVVLARSPGGEIGNTAAVSFQVTSSATTAVTSKEPRPRAGAGLTPSRSSISTGAVLLAGGAGAIAALCCFGGLLVLGRKRGAAAVGARRTP